jgi:DNA-binding response OmpR family regulator
VTDALSLRILLVEDEALIAMMAEDMIETLGHRVVRTASTLSDAHAACDDSTFDVALLDVNLNGESSMEVATRLKTRGCALAFTTGYGAGGIDPAHAGAPVLTKPYAVTELEAILAIFAAQGAGSSSITSTVDSNRG